jgi:hypothetical protein
MIEVFTSLSLLERIDNSLFKNEIGFSRFQLFIDGLSDFVWIVDADSEEELVLYVECNPFADILSQSCKVFDMMSLDEYIKSKTYSDGSLSKLILTEKSMKSIIQDGHINIAIDNFRDIWDLINPFRKDLEPIFAPKSDVAKYKVSRYEDFLNYIFPLNSIIIFDKFLLTNLPWQPVSKNFVPLMDTIFSTLPKGAKINISILVDKGSVYVKKDKSVASLLETYSKVSSLLSRYKYDFDLSINLILYSKEEAESILKVREHDRFIITNNQIISSGVGFCNLDKNNKINNRGEIHIGSIFTESKREKIKSHINALNKYVKSISNDFKKIQGSGIPMLLKSK